MKFEILDMESEKLLKELLAEDKVINKNIRGTAIEYLVEQNYIKGLSARTNEDSEPVYIVTEITQKGKSYFENKRADEKEKRKLSRREWRIAIIGAIVGGIIGLIPTILQLMGVV